MTSTPSYRLLHYSNPMLMLVLLFQRNNNPYYLRTGKCSSGPMYRLIEIRVADEARVFKTLREKTAPALDRTF